jgi:hypothetical protein
MPAYFVVELEITNQTAMDSIGLVAPMMKDSKRGHLDPKSHNRDRRVCSSVAPCPPLGS